jgi:hypothetical protein
MKYKSGLHKKVSSIFGGISLPESSPQSPADKNIADANIAETSAANPPVSGIDSRFADGYGKQPHQASVLDTATRTIAKIDDNLTEDQEYAASQRRKLFLVIGLCVVFALVLFFFYRPKPNRVPAGQKTSSKSVIAAKNAKIYWPEPEPWPADIRDPMVLGSSPVSVGGLALKGIVYLPQGRSSVLIGTEIYYEGDAVKDTNWTVMKIFIDSVELQNPEGEEKKITMEGR